MRVVILGAGLMGVTSAWYLAEAGHEVTVIDRREGVARETSFANAGLVAPGHVYSWASPRAPKMLLRSLWRSDTALRFRLRLDPRLWAWGLRFLANCTAERNRANTLVKLRLCMYSRDALVALRQQTGIAYDEISAGNLYLYRDRAHYETGLANMRLLIDNGLPLEALDIDGIVAREPKLAHAKDKLAGAIVSPTDESGDAYLFTSRLAELCAARGVKFQFNTTIAGIERDGDRMTGVATSGGRVVGDRYVLALGSFSPLVSRGLGLPIYPVKGYSVTIPTEGFDGAPTTGGVDEGNLVAFCPMGNRLRLTATADFAGYSTDYEASDFAVMLRSARELFPNAGAWDKPSYGACLRPMTPEGAPIIGPSKLSNLWLNTGQGHMGWTMACGSSRLLTDLMTGRKPDLDPADYSAARY